MWGEVGIVCSWALDVAGQCKGRNAPIFYRMCPWTFVVVRVLLFLEYTKERILISFNGMFSSTDREKERRFSGAFLKNRWNIAVRDFLVAY